MRRLRNYGACMAAAVLSAALLLASCRHAGGGGGGGGAVYTPSSGSSGGGTEAAASTTATYTSYDSAGGYFNVNGGQYRTCTLTGNSTGGTITLSNGTGEDLSGTYGTPPSSTVSLAASVNVEVRIEGVWVVSLYASGSVSGCTFTMFVTSGFLTFKWTDRNGNECSCTGGAATNLSSNPDSDGTPISPGSAEDPFNGTEWDFSLGRTTNPAYRFDNGTCYCLGSYFGPYLVRRTSEGYKVCFNFVEIDYGTIRNANPWAYAFMTFTISSTDAIEPNDRIQTETFYIGDQLNLHEFWPDQYIVRR